MEPIKLTLEEAAVIQELHQEAQRTLNLQLYGILQLLKKLYKIKGNCSISLDGTELIVTEEK